MSFKISEMLGVKKCKWCSQWKPKKDIDHNTDTCSDCMKSGGVKDIDPTKNKMQFREGMGGQVATARR